MHAAHKHGYSMCLALKFMVRGNSGEKSLRKLWGSELGLIMGGSLRNKPPTPCTHRLSVPAAQHRAKNGEGGLGKSAVMICPPHVLEALSTG